MNIDKGHQIIAWKVLEKVTPELNIERDTYGKLGRKNIPDR